MAVDLAGLVSTFGWQSAAKLSNPAVHGEPEDQLRAPLEGLLAGLAVLCGFGEGDVSAVGESQLSDLKTRPDYAVTVRNALVGFIEVKAPGKGADPRRYREPHDRLQWEKLQSLPNLVYTDGNGFSLWRNGELTGGVVHLIGDVETSGAALTAPASLQALFEDFFRWQPQAPRTPKQLAETSARLCRLLRDEVLEQLGRESPALIALRTDWRRMLFPDATDETFADGYAQALTFGMLMARANGLALGRGLDIAARELGQRGSIIGTAVRLLTDEVSGQEVLKTSLGTLVRVLDAVHWPKISKGNPDAWLYFYEDFLSVYDNDLRKQTGSYYTPVEVVDTMVRLVDEALKSPARFNRHAGLASGDVTIADPAAGTGTFPLGVLRQVARTTERLEGPGAVPGAIDAATSRLIAFEIQLGPFAVAQLRTTAEISHLTGGVPTRPLRMFVTDTLGNPYVEEEWLPAFAAPIAESRRQANHIKIHEPITVVIGNPPYKEKAKGRGGWVEAGGGNSPEEAPLRAWVPPSDWGVGAHAKHLRNLYVYFWRWATWKVFDRHPTDSSGIVCFISVAGFLNGPGFQKMRDYLRRTADEIWVIDCSPEGHQPEVATRIFQGVQQPVCIVLASRGSESRRDQPATVRFRALPPGRREEKFAALAQLSLDDPAWLECPIDWRAPFLPAAAGEWATFPSLDSLFLYNGSGVMPGRTWVIAPDMESLHQRWRVLTSAKPEDKEHLFHPHLRKGKPGDKHSEKVVAQGLPGYAARPLPVAADRGAIMPPVPYGFRSFDRQWIVPDNRLINQPNPELWADHSDRQVYLTALAAHSPSSGPALTFTGLIPDLHHYKGSFGGRAFPLWRDPAATIPNVQPGLLAYLRQRFEMPLGAEDVLAYIAAVAAHPAFTARFAPDLVKPGLRIPLTADAQLFAEAVELGRKVIWLHTFGERFSDPTRGRPMSPPRQPDGPYVPAGGAIPQDAAGMPDTIEYDPGARCLHIGSGFVERVDPRVWGYEISGKQVLRQWFSYRRRSRERPIIGDRRPPSPLGKIQPDQWLAAYTSELVNVLHVLACLVDLEPIQANLLERICAAPTIPPEDLSLALAAHGAAGPVNRSAMDQPSFLT